MHHVKTRTYLSLFIIVTIPIDEFIDCVRQLLLYQNSGYLIVQSVPPSVLTYLGKSCTPTEQKGGLCATREAQSNDLPASLLLLKVSRSCVTLYPEQI